ncbi:MAG: LysR family transcriptional regulator [Betaproteobacteria bacterium]|nr:MAG: LysR family transcriptional regulator [Betaproteobacteria bacterium]
MNIRSLDVHLLRCFDALMAELSVSRAAEQMNLSQPAMSHALARLRRLFDDPLLLRAQSAMVPTRHALELRESVGRILAEIDGVVLRRSAFRAETSRMKFVLTAPEYVEYVLAPKLFGVLQREAPGVDIEFRTPNPERISEWMEKGEIDFRLAWLRDPPHSLHSKFLFRDQFVCLVRKGHPQIRGAMTAEQYFSLPHVRSRFMRNSPSGRVIDEVVASHGRKLRIALLMQNFLTVFYTVAHTDLIATVPERLARGLADQLSLQALEPPVNIPDMRISMYWHERTQKEASHRWFRQILADVVKEL